MPRLVREMKAWFVFLTVTFCPMARAQFVEWTWLNPLPQGNTLNAVAVGRGSLVAVGDVGAVVTTANGNTWAKSDSSTDKSLYSICWGGNLYVAVGGSGAIFTSPDGSKWSPQASGVKADLYGVVFHMKSFVAVGDAGTVLTSPDGVKWTKSESNVSNSLRAVASSGKQVVAVGLDGRVIVSPDGATWRVAGTVDCDLYAVAWGKDCFVAAGHSNHDDIYNGIYSSRDGLNWTGKAENEFVGSGPLYLGVLWTGRQFVVYGNGRTKTSPDGAHWSDVPESKSHTSRKLKAVVPANGRYFGVGDDGWIATSNDGIAWVPRLPQTGAITSLADNGKILVGIEPEGASAIKDFGIPAEPGKAVWTSPDGIAWRRSQISLNVRYVTTNGTIFVAYGWDGAAISDDGLGWRTVVQGKPLASVTWNGREFLAAGMRGLVLASADGLRWTMRRPDNTRGFGGDTLALAWGGDLYIGGSYGGIYTSSDGVAWTLHDVSPRTSPRQGSVYQAACWGDGRFVVVGRGSDPLMTSTDGTTWEKGKLNMGNRSWDLRSVIWDGHEFVAAGITYSGYDIRSGVILVSTNGVDWTEPSKPTTNSLHALVSRGDTLFVGGDAGGILRGRRKEPAH